MEIVKFFWEFHRKFAAPSCRVSEKPYTRWFGRYWGWLDECNNVIWQTLRRNDCSFLLLLFLFQWKKKFYHLVFGDTVSSKIFFRDIFFLHFTRRKRRVFDNDCRRPVIAFLYSSTANSKRSFPLDHDDLVARILNTHDLQYLSRWRRV